MSSKFSFSLEDYIVFGICLAISAAIGIYYRVSGGKQKSTSKMGFAPVAFSLMASLMSAITLMGVSSEIYMYGIQFALINISYILATPIAAYIFLPIFYVLGNRSIYQYLEQRFSKLLKFAASFTYIIQMMLYVGVVLYVPSLALAAVTALRIEYSILSVGLVCTFYSTIGGIKAVLITDLFQSILMYAAVWAIIIVGVLKISSFEAIWNIAYEGERLSVISLDPDPTVRHTVWSLCFGGMFLYLSLYATSQTQIQRLLTVKSLKEAQLALWVQWPILTLLSLSTCFSGLVMYAYYASCDPILYGKISVPDQLMPLFVMETMSSNPGLPGLFISGLFSGSLSSVSSTVNCLATVFMEDYLQELFNWKDTKKAFWSKFLVFIFSMLAVFLAFIVQFLGKGVLQISLTIFGAVGGPLLGLFCLGIFVKRATSKGAFLGYIFSVIFCLWIAFGSPKPPVVPLSQCVDKCDFNSNNNSYHLTALYYNCTSPVIPNYADYFYLYRISYMWYSAIGCILTIVVGICFSLFDKSPLYVDKRLLFKLSANKKDSDAVIQGDKNFHEKSPYVVSHPLSTECTHF